MQRERSGSISLARSAARITLLDIRRLPFDLVINVICRSRLVPRPIRTASYRLAGMSIRTMNVQNGCTFKSRRVTIGRRSFVNADCVFDNQAAVIIGDECNIAMQVLFCTSSHSPGVPERRAGLETHEPIRIEDGCWIGARATILPGVTVGAGCVIAAGAIVAASCDPHGLYAGVPARRIRELAPGDGVAEFAVEVD
jgi:maltose O-acetyltransferase